MHGCAAFDVVTREDVVCSVVALHNECEETENVGLVNDRSSWLSDWLGGLNCCHLTLGPLLWGSSVSGQGAPVREVARAITALTGFAWQGIAYGIVHRAIICCGLLELAVKSGDSLALCSDLGESCASLLFLVSGEGAH